MVNICIFVLVASTQLVRGAMFTCFFGSTGVKDFFVGAFDLRDIGASGATLAVFFSTLFSDGAIEVSARTFKLHFCCIASVLAVLNTFGTEHSLFSSFFWAGNSVERTAILVRSFLRPGNVFSCDLKNPVILVCEPRFGATWLAVMPFTFFASILLASLVDGFCFIFTRALLSIVTSSFLPFSLGHIKELLFKRFRLAVIKPESVARLRFDFDETLLVFDIDDAAAIVAVVIADDAVVISAAAFLAINGVCDELLAELGVVTVAAVATSTFHGHGRTIFSGVESDVFEIALLAIVLFLDFAEVLLRFVSPLEFECSSLDDGLYGEPGLEASSHDVPLESVNVATPLK